MAIYPSLLRHPLKRNVLENPIIVGYCFQNRQAVGLTLSFSDNCEVNMTYKAISREADEVAKLKNEHKES